MKKIISVILLIVLGKIAMAQCINGSSTNPENPNNEDLLPWANLNIPNGGNTFTTNPFLNKFNYEDPYQSIDVLQNAGFNIGSVTWINNRYPMYHPFNTGLPSGYDYYNALLTPNVSDRDFKWQDGWELLYLNLGYTPDLEPIFKPASNGPLMNPESASPVNIPYFVLYNRYKGIIRLFANVWFDATNPRYQEVKATLKFSTGKEVNGMLRHASSYDQALDIETITDEINGPSLHPVNANEWMLADFQIGYDPCICTRNTSKLVFEFAAFDKMSLDMISRTITIEKAITDKSFLKDDFMNLANEDASSYKSGSRIYREMSTMVDAYDKALVEYQNNLANYNSLDMVLKRTFLTTLKAGISSAGGIVGSGVASSLFTNKPLRDFVLENKTRVSLIRDSLIGLDTSDANAFAQSLIGGSKSVISKGFDFLSTTFEIPNEPVKPTPPTASFSETTFKGTISRVQVTSTNSLLVPGAIPNAYNGGNPGINKLNYPAYNETLGLFALLKTPKADVKKETFSQDEILANFKANPSPDPFNVTRAPIGNRYSIKLREPLSFRYNHAVDFDFKKTKLYYSFRITFRTNQLIFTDPFFGGTIDGDPRILGQSMALTGGKGVSYESFTNGPRLRTVATTPFVEVTNALNQPHFFTTNYVIDWSAGTTTSSIGFINVFNFDVNIIERIEIKLMADMYFQSTGSAGQPLNTVQTFTYVLYDASEGAEKNQIDNEPIVKRNVTFLERGHANWQRIPNGDLIFDNISLSPATLGMFPGSRMGINGELHFFGKNVIMRNHVAVDPGYTAVIHYLNTVTSEPESVVDPEMIAKELTEDDFYGNPRIYEATDGDVTSFCDRNTNLYHADVSLSKTAQNPDKPNTKPREKDRVANMYVYPNPGNQSTNVSFELLKDADVSISLLNLSGQTVLSVLKDKPAVSGAHSVNIDLSSVAPGVYLCAVVFSDGHKEVAKIVVVK